MWQSEIRDWEKVDDKIYEFVMNESEKKTKDVIEDSEKITNRAYNLINILVILIGVIVSYIIKSISDNKAHEPLTILSFILLIPILICFYKCYKLVSKRIICRNGTDPKEILISKYIERENYDGNDKYKRLVLFAIEQNQEKISLIEENNSIRVNKYQSVLQILFYSFIVSLILIVSISIF
jgi:predicted PurR-regulated permease PerM